MATINDIGTPGSPLDTPPLTEWQAAVRDAVTALQATNHKAGTTGLVTTDANGVVTITHNLGRIPTAFLTTLSGNTTVAATALAGVRVTSTTATTATLLVTRSDTQAVFANQGIGFYWIAT